MLISINLVYFFIQIRVFLTVVVYDWSMIGI